MATIMGGSTRKRDVGQIFTVAGVTPPRGALACSGELANVADWPRLYAVIGDRFAAPGDTLGGATFRLPGTEATQIYLRQAVKVETAGVPFDVSLLTASYSGMPGTLWTDYGHYYSAAPEAGYDNLQIFRATTWGASYGRFTWADNALSTGRYYYPTLLQAGFDQAHQTRITAGVAKDGSPDTQRYWVEFDLTHNGATVVITAVRARTPSSVTTITGTAFPGGLASRTFAGATLDIPFLLWTDWDAMEWGCQIFGQSVNLGALENPVFYVPWPGPGPGRHLFSPHYRYDWIGGGTGTGNYLPLDVSALGGSLWSGAALTAPDGMTNFFDQPGSVYWDTGQRGGSATHGHTAEGYALAAENLPALDVTTQGYEGSSAPAVDSVAYSATPGTAHTHTIDTVNNEPPFVDVLFCIQAK